jgi:hypothetical protein
MLSVMRDESVDPIRRDRMAVAAAAYVHPRVSSDPPQGKKARAEEFAKTAHVGSRWEELLVNRLKPAAPVASDWESPYRWPGTDDE